MVRGHWYVDIITWTLVRGQKAGENIRFMSTHKRRQVRQVRQYIKLSMVLADHLVFG